MRTKYALYNTLSLVLLQVVISLFGFILPQFIISTYGSDTNGLISSIKQFISYLNIVEMGIATAATVSLYKPLNDRNWDQINGILHTMKKLYLRSGIMFSIGILIISFIYPAFVSLQMGYFLPFILCIILGISGISEYFILGKYRVILVADQRNYVISIVQTISYIFVLVVSIIQIKLGMSIIAVQLTSSIVFIGRAFVIANYTIKKYKKLDMSVVPIKLDKNPIDVLVHQVAGIIVNSCPIVVLTLSSDLSVVSIYSIYNMVFSSLKLILSTITNGLLASFGSLVVSGDKGKLISVFSKYEYIYMILLNIVFTCASLLVIPFMTVYSRNFSDTNYILPNLALLFIIVSILDCIRVPSVTMVSAHGLYKETRNRAIIEAGLNIMFTAVFGFLYSINGVLLGSIVSFGYRTIDFLLYNKNVILDNQHNKTFKRIIFNLIIGILLFTLINNYFQLNVNNWYQWFEKAITIGVVSSIIIITCNTVKEPKEMSLILNLIKKIFKK